MSFLSLSQSLTPSLLAAAGTSFDVITELDPATDPFLRDHMFEKDGDRFALLPGVAFMQMAAESARFHNQGLHLLEMNNTSFERVLFVPENGTKQVTLRHQMIADRSDYAELTVSLLGPGKHETDPPRTHARTHVVLGTRQVAGPFIKPHQQPRSTKVARRIVGRDVYQAGFVPNTGIMAVAGAMSVFSNDHAKLSFNETVLGNAEGLSYAALESLPLQMCLGIDGACWLELISSTQLDDPLSGLISPARIFSVHYYAPPAPSDLPHLGTWVRRSIDGFDFTIFNEESGQAFADVWGIETANWKPWRDRPAPTQRQFFGDSD